jgi:hypothetical protein
LRQFASSGFRIWNLSREAKLVYTGFCVFALLAIAVSILFYEDLVGGGGVKAYYAGEMAAPSESATGGPKMELPPQERLTVAVTYRKLLEVTHFHLFTVPVFLLIIAHLFMLTGAPGKTWWIAGGWLSSLVHLAAPWLIRYQSASWSVLYPLSGAAMTLTLTVMTGWPIIAMWRGAPAREDEAASS